MPGTILRHSATRRQHGYGLQRDLGFASGRYCHRRRDGRRVDHANELTIAEGGSDAYQVVLTSQPTDDVTVTITHSGDGDIGNDHQELTFTGSDWERRRQ